MTRGCMDCGRDNDNGTHTALEQTGHLSHRYNPRGELEGLIADQMQWSLATFGPGDREQGVIKHIQKELEEIDMARGGDKLGEWIDVVILALDGAWRSGAEPADVVSALLAKYQKNRNRVWPDWRTADPDEPIEHVAGVHD
jgi:hypothetical protein